MSSAALATEFAEFLAYKERSGYKHDAPGTPPATGYAHGPGGLLTYPGVDPDVFHTIVGTLPGIINELPSVPSVYTNPTYEVITGVQAGSGDEPETACGPAPIGGLMKGGIVTFPFGKYQRATREIELNRLGQRNDRADPVDLRLVGSPMSRGIFGAGVDDGSVPGSALTNEIDKVMFERAIEFNRLLSRQIWRGNPSSGATAGYTEFGGFELMIQNNWVDAITGGALPSLYPDIKNFSLARVDSNGDALINAMTYMMRFVGDLAERTGVMPVRWAWVMRPNAFYEITKVWPCSYLTSVCALVNNGSNAFNVDAGDVVNMRDDMRRGRYLIIDGARVPVILDDGITEYTNPSLSSAIADNLTLARVVGGGAFLETLVQTRWCVQWQAKIEPRLIMRTPWLAGRLQNVQYCPLQTPRQAYPEDPYWVNGGLTTRPGPSLYNPF